MSNKRIRELVITDSTKIKAYGEHTGKIYKVYFDNMSPELIYFEFDRRWQMEEFLYNHGFEKFTYKSSNGSTINKKWEYIQSKLNEYNNLYGKNKGHVFPEKYSWEDYYCGHYVKE